MMGLAIKAETRSIAVNAADPTSPWEATRCQYWDLFTDRPKDLLSKSDEDLMGSSERLLVRLLYGDESNESIGLADIIMQPISKISKWQL